MLTGMCGNLEFATVAFVSAELDSEDAFASNFVLVAASQELSGFSCEHTTHDKFNASTLTWFRAEEEFLARLLLRLACGCLFSIVCRYLFASLDGWRKEL
jgi:hypothetical protein